MTFVAVVLVPFDEAQDVTSHELKLEEESESYDCNSFSIFQQRIAELLGGESHDGNVLPALETPLFRPYDDSGVAVAGMYAYHNGRSGKSNIRATRLAMACGQLRLRFFGDVVIARSFGGRLASLDLSDIHSGISISPDLRLDIQSSLGDGTVVRPAEWLAGAAQRNYHDKVELAKIADVMNRPEEDSDGDSEEGSKDGDCDSKSDDDDGETSNEPALERSNEFVTRSPLCMHCRGPTSNLCLRCEGCYFCPDTNCRSLGWSHECQCKTWRCYTSRRESLSKFEYLGDWHRQLTEREFQVSEMPYEDFLRSLGISADDNTWWKTETKGWSGGQSSSAAAVDITIRRNYVDGFAPLSQIPLQQRVSEDDTNSLNIPKNELGLLDLRSWEDYYRLRGIPSTSPVALLCTFPLTVYHAIVKYGEVPSTVASMLNRPLRIHIVGAEKELNFLDLFQEIGLLLPKNFRIELTFVVRQDCLPPKCKTPVSIKLLENVKIFVLAGTYGGSINPSFDCEGGDPDMLIALNAGLFAYESWRSVVTYLYHHPGIVGVFTDYNETSGVHCASLGGSKSRESLCMNPFRQPRAMPVYSMNLPQFSNGFIYVFNEQELE